MSNLTPTAELAEKTRKKLKDDLRAGYKAQKGFKAELFKDSLFTQYAAMAAGSHKFTTTKIQNAGLASHLETVQDKINGAVKDINKALEGLETIDLNGIDLNIPDQNSDPAIKYSNLLGSANLLEFTNIANIQASENLDTEAMNPDNKLAQIQKCQTDIIVALKKLKDQGRFDDDLLAESHLNTNEITNLFTSIANNLIKEKTKSITTNKKYNQNITKAALWVVAGLLVGGVATVAALYVTGNLGMIYATSVAVSGHSASIYKSLSYYSNAALNYFHRLDKNFAILDSLKKGTYLGAAAYIISSVLFEKQVKDLKNWLVSNPGMEIDYAVFKSKSNLRWLNSDWMDAQTELEIRQNLIEMFAAMDRSKDDNFKQRANVKLEVLKAKTPRDFLTDVNELRTQFCYLPNLKDGQVNARNNLDKLINKNLTKLEELQAKGLGLDSVSVNVILQRIYSNVSIIQQFITSTTDTEILPATKEALNVCIATLIGPNGYFKPAEQAPEQALL
ncbi:hypothetical protein [Rickettsiales endosymbiont of Stachyamoeba lipophora]|uniref:hypothetical protein n=1 Tax=Rickettsiales endosymbiont of Stachyamoeba lipophora TaxID=2486578 RepID=UPI000F64C443|nr:hypothetical protein [Rickettsiales endosymbiont of Stachyamoeba lipophora]AZL15005.1 hypothetical protein EF513_00270 [Rickettsiales endosymbiont of Stachyamoeba lipophora]